MATQSSPGVMFRVLVMLACLVAIPLAAVFGKSLPDMLKTFFGGRWPVRSASARGPVSEPPPLELMLPADAAPAVPARRSASDVQGKPLPIPRSRPGGRVVAAGFESLSVPASVSRGAEWPDGAVCPAEPGDPAVAQASPMVDQFTYVQDRLRQLGATYYLLESWGNRQRLYRFYCRVAIGDDPTYAKCFEATDPDRLKAMGRVLQEVEAWRGGRR